MFYISIWRIIQVKGQYNSNSSDWRHKWHCYSTKRLQDLSSETKVTLEYDRGTRKLASSLTAQSAIWVLVNLWINRGKLWAIIERLLSWEGAGGNPETQIFATIERCGEQVWATYAVQWKYQSPATGIKNNEQSILAPLVTRNTVVLVGMEKLWEDYVATLVDNFDQKPEDGQYIEKKSDALFDDPTRR